jgi:hypothetical protein
VIVRSRVRFPAVPWGCLLEREVSRGDHGLDNLVELEFKAPPGTSYITIHLTGTTPHERSSLRSRLHLSHNREGDHKVHKGHVVAWGGGGKKR